MCELGWDTRPGVKIIFGKWQDVLPILDTYDGIFFDTYSEFWCARRRRFHNLYYL